MLLRHEGMTHDNASKALDITSQSGWNLAGRIRRKTGVKVRSLGLSDSKYVKAAHRAVHKLARGKVVGDMETVTGPTVMAAVNTILDRAEPVIRKQMNLNVKVDVSPVDLDKYLMPEGPRPQDVVIDVPHNQHSELSD